MSDNLIKVFLLSTSWTDDKKYPLEFYGVSDHGPVLLKFSTEKFTVFVEQQANVASFTGSFSQKNLKLTSFDNKPVKAIYLNSQNDFFNFRKFAEQNSIRTYENDIWPGERFLMERFIFGQVEVMGDATEEDSLQTFINPSVRPCSYKPQMNILSFDIETGVDGTVYSIASDYTGKKKFQHVYMRSDAYTKVDESLTFYPNEKHMIQSFIDDLLIYDPDIIIGWHVIGFDLKFLYNRCLKLGINFSIGRNRTKILLEEKKGLGTFAKIPGRVVLDGPPTLRNAFYSFKNFKLETVASEILGTGKDIASDNNKVTEIERRFKEDKKALAKYNLLDATLVTEIFNKLDLVEHSIERVINSGLLFDKQGISTASFDHYMLPLFHRNGFVAPNASDLEREDASSGGMVIEPKVGRHKNVGVFDFKSLYPSIIRTFNIDPFSRLHTENNYLRLPNGLKFSKEKHFLPDIINNLMQKRAIAKKHDNKAMSMAVKILMNSFYGVMGSLRCRFYHSDLPKAITETGHWILKQSIEFFNNRNMDVLYGDTDSLFVDLNSIDSNEQNCKQLAADLTIFLDQLIKDEIGVTSYLELEFEKVYSELFFTTTRDSEIGAKKRYVGLSSGELNFVGMEYVRSDWTELAKNFQYGLYDHFFQDLSVEIYIKNFISELKNGRFDDLLIYTKKLSKDPKEYVKNIPQHVKAALQVDHKGPYRLKEVSYIMTLNGPVPIQNPIGHIDYHHYIDKQIKPIANQVLRAIGSDFDSIEVGDQLSLF